jgi:hypothetical protein
MSVYENLKRKNGRKKWYEELREQSKTYRTEML